jgi:hypothetical protein
MNPNKRDLIFNEEEFDQTVWQKAQLGNNSGYLDEKYETTQPFPTLPDYHFRI